MSSQITGRSKLMSYLKKVLPFKNNCKKREDVIFCRKKTIWLLKQYWKWGSTIYCFKMHDQLINWNDSFLQEFPPQTSCYEITRVCLHLNCSSPSPGRIFEYMRVYMIHSFGPVSKTQSILQRERSVIGVDWPNWSVWVFWLSRLYGRAKTAIADQNRQPISNFKVMDEIQKKRNAVSASVSIGLGKVFWDRYLIHRIWKQRQC